MVDYLRDADFVHCLGVLAGLGDRRRVTGPAGRGHVVAAAFK